MAYCICRIAKLKSGGAITASEQHTLRTRETPNADLSQENERFIGNHPIRSPIPPPALNTLDQMKKGERVNGMRNS
jgi:hypothetical protein